MTSQTIDQVRTTGGCKNCLDVMDAFDRVLRDLDQDWDMVARRVASLAADSFIQFDMGLALDQINPGSVTVFTPDRGTPPEQITGCYFRLSCQDGAAPCSGCPRLESLLAAEGFGKVTTFPLLEGDDCYGALLARADDADALERATPFFQHIAYNTVVKRHGGALTFETEPGVGTTFVLRIPVAGAGDTPDA